MVAVQELVTTVVVEAAADQAEMLPVAAWAPRSGDRSQLAEAPLCPLDQDI